MANETDKFYHRLGEIALDLAKQGTQMGWSELNNIIDQEFGFSYETHMGLSSAVYNGAGSYWSDTPEVVDALNNVFCSG